MLKVVRNVISLTRGDTATFRLQIKNQDGTDYEITPADTGDFVADYATDAECVAVIDDIFDNLLKGEE